MIFELVVSGLACWGCDYQSSNRTEPQTRKFSNPRVPPLKTMIQMDIEKNFKKSQLDLIHALLTLTERPSKWFPLMVHMGQE